uniref:Cilia- and flagella-associated protein 52 n=1 Tax=Calcidiscus leptoporus TaxID=127549 RepID=A0A7S0ILU1_9EUKA
MAICGSPASHDVATTCTWLNTTEAALVTGGVNQLRVWDFDPEHRKVRPTECTTGKEKRAYNCIAISQDDKAIFAGTDSGDVLKIDTQSKRLLINGPKKRLEKGVKSLVYNCATGQVIAGSGSGQLVTLSDSLERLGCAHVLEGAVTSIALDQPGEFFFAGTAHSNMYLVPADNLGAAELKCTSHHDKINDIAFPKGYASLFATCSASEIRVWHSGTMNELIRIQVPNLECNCIVFPSDGTAILSGWSDGKIRSFGPQSGCLQYVINDAHRLTGVGNSSGGVVPQNGVTSLCPTNDTRKLISGGADGKVRVWAVSKGQQVMLASMQEHKGPISSLVVTEDDSMCVSASADGSCIVWQLTGMMPFVRANALFAANFFKAALYGPNECQLLTCGTDRKITYWDVTTMQAIRILDGSDVAEVNTLAISKSDEPLFVSGGADKKVCVWNYNEGAMHYEGTAHSGAVKKVMVAPDEKTIVSVGSEGAICIWTTPQDVATGA